MNSRGTAPARERFGATPEESIDIMMTVEALLRSARCGLPVEVA
jgi:hypothetical protein